MPAPLMNWRKPWKSRSTWLLAPPALSRRSMIAVMVRGAMRWSRRALARVSTRARSVSSPASVTYASDELSVSAELDIGEAGRAERQVAGAGDVALEGGNSIGGTDPGDVGEVDLVGTVLEVGGLVGC